MAAASGSDDSNLRSNFFTTTASIAIISQASTIRSSFGCFTCAFRTPGHFTTTFFNPSRPFKVGKYMHVAVAGLIVYAPA